MEYQTLNNGLKIPTIGFGVFRVPDKKECEESIYQAIKAGYRLIDTAQSYGNEEAVGKAIKETNVPREELFITTKVWISNYGYEQAKASVEESLKKMQLDYLDLVLLHQPFKDYHGAYRALVDLYKEYDNDKVSEEDFYNLENITYKYEIMDDIVYLEVESDIYKEAFFVDKNGIVLKKISDMNLSLKKSDDLNYLVAYDILKAEGNSIYIKVRRFYESAACSDVLDNKGDAIYSTVDKITYVGENKFTIEKKVSDTITSGEYVESNGGINFCSENIGVK